MKKVPVSAAKPDLNENDLFSVFTENETLNLQSMRCIRGGDGDGGDGGDPIIIIPPPPG